MGRQRQTCVRRAHTLSGGRSRAHRDWSRSWHLPGRSDGLTACLSTTSSCSGCGGTASPGRSSASGSSSCRSWYSPFRRDYPIRRWLRVRRGLGLSSTRSSASYWVLPRLRLRQGSGKAGGRADDRQGKACPNRRIAPIAQGPCRNLRAVPATGTPKDADELRSGPVTARLGRFLALSVPARAPRLDGQHALRIASI